LTAKGITVVFCDDFDQSGSLSSQWRTTATGTSTVGVDKSLAESAPNAALVTGAGYRFNAVDAAISGSGALIADPLEDGGTYTLSFDIEMDESTEGAGLSIDFPDKDFTLANLEISPGSSRWTIEGNNFAQSDAAPFAVHAFHHVTMSLANALLTFTMDGMNLGMFAGPSAARNGGMPQLNLRFSANAADPTTNGNVVTAGPSTHLRVDNVILTVP
jgi:hypothetical protein